MKMKILILLLFLMMFSVNVFAGQIKEIILTDESVIYGDISSLANGKYSIKTDNFGVIEIEEDKVISIKNKSEGRDISKTDVSNLKFSGSEPTEPSAVKAGINALKRSMDNDTGTMESISNLQNDPDFMAILNDPVIMSAVEAGDINTLSSNPKFLKLLNHPIVRGVGGKVE
ncbi:MAG: hypothetical protein L6416_12915 [Candidatus Omnitrophica bacterium]|nr:hypothetical protein [Candidatus Omnitrophota bacterium]